MTSTYGPPCPVCSPPGAGPEPAPCPSCGPPAVEREPAAVPPPSPWVALRQALLLLGALAVVAAAVALVSLALGVGATPGVGIPPELRLALACGTVTVTALVLGRRTGNTTAWPLMALLAAQPLPLLLFSAWSYAGAATLAGLLSTVLLDTVALARLPVVPASVAEVLMRLGAALAVVVGPLLAWAGSMTDSWTATGLLAVAGAGAILLRRHPRLASRLPRSPNLVAATAVVVALALAGSLALTF